MGLFYNIGKLVKEKREEKGLSQRKLAELADVSHTEISRIESGERKRPAPYILRRIAPHLGVEYEKLLKVAGYEELMIERTSPVVEEEPAIYRSVIEDFADSASPEDVEKAKEYLRFLIEQRKKRGQ